MNNFIHLSDFFCKFLPFCCRDPSQLKSFRLNATSTEFALPILKTLPSKAVSVVVMAVGSGVCQSTACDEDCTSAFLKSTVDKTFLKACRAHGSNDPGRGRILSFLYSCQIRTSVRTPVAREYETFRFGIFFQSCINLGQDLILRERGHLDGVKIACKPLPGCGWCLL